MYDVSGEKVFSCQPIQVSYIWKQAYLRGDYLDSITDVHSTQKKWNEQARAVWVSCDQQEKDRGSERRGTSRSSCVLTSDAPRGEILLGRQTAALRWCYEQLGLRYDVKQGFFLT